MAGNALTKRGRHCCQPPCRRPARPRGVAAPFGRRSGVRPGRLGGVGRFGHRGRPDTRPTRGIAHPMSASMAFTDQRTCEHIPRSAGRSVLSGLAAVKRRSSGLRSTPGPGKPVPVDRSRWITEAPSPDLPVPPAGLQSRRGRTPFAKSGSSAVPFLHRPVDRSMAAACAVAIVRPSRTGSPARPSRLRFPKAPAARYRRSSG